MTLLQIYFILLDSTTLYYGSTWVYPCPTSFYLNVLPFTEALLHSTWLHSGMTVLDCTMVLLHIPLHYLSVHDSTPLYHGFTWLYPCSTSFYLNLLHSTCPTTLYHDSTSLHLTLLHSTMALLFVYYTLLHSTMTILHSLWIHFIIPWLYFTLLYSTKALHGCYWIILS